jgi:transposase
MEDANQPLTVTAGQFLNALYQEIIVKDQQIKSTEKQLHCLLSSNPDYQRIQQVPGVGPVVAAGTITVIGYGKQFRMVDSSLLGLVLLPDNLPVVKMMSMAVLANEATGIPKALNL